MAAFTPKDVPLVVSTKHVEARMTDVGGMTFIYYKIRKGTDFASLLKGLPQDMCHCPHWGYTFKGRTLIHTQAGDEFTEPGQAFYIPPGHVPEFLEDCEFIEWSPTPEYKQLMAHMMQRTEAIKSERKKEKGPPK